MHGADHHDPYAELKRDAESYRVFDQHFHNVGRVDDLYVDDGDRPIYIGVTTGILEFGSTPIPVEVVRINDKRKLIEIAESSEQVKHAPTLGDGEELTPELEEKVRVYFGLRGPRTFADHGPTDGTIEDNLAPDERIDLVPGERKAAEDFEAPRTPNRDPDPRVSDTEPGKEWARGTEGHRSDAGRPRSRRRI